MSDLIKRFTAREQCAALVLRLGQAIRNGKADCQDTALARQMIEEFASEIDRLRGLADERDELVSEVARLQRALAFWLPCIQGGGPIYERAGDDAMLLFGYEAGAEELGWIDVRAPVSEEATP